MDVAIDLGSSCVRLGTAEKGILRREPSLIGIDRGNGRFLAFGREAEKRFSAEPQRVSLHRPFKGGYFETDLRGICYTESVLRSLLSTAIENSAAEEPIRLLMAVPCSMSATDKKRLCDMACRAGATESRVVEAPCAVMFGNGIDPRKSTMIIDMGASTTNIAIVSRARVLYHVTENVGGELFDRALMDYTREEYRVDLHPSTAEKLKCAIGTMSIETTPKQATVHGKGNAGNAALTLQSGELFSVWTEPFAEIMEVIRRSIEAIRSECVEEIFSRGILLSGGTADFDGIDEMIQGLCSVWTGTAENPPDSVIRGLIGIERRMNGIWPKQPDLTTYILTATAETLRSQERESKKKRQG